jgi:hypothetical protein
MNNSYDFAIDLIKDNRKINYEEFTNMAMKYVFIDDM